MDFYILGLMHVVVVLLVIGVYLQPFFALLLIVFLISITGEVEESLIKNNFLGKTKTNTKTMTKHHSLDGTK